MGLQACGGEWVVEMLIAERRASSSSKDPPEVLQFGPRPDEIAARRFSASLFGLHPQEVQRFLLEIGAALDHTRTALTNEVLRSRALERALQGARGTIEELQQQLGGAQAEERVPHGVDSTAGAASVQGAEIVAAARQAAEVILQNAQVAALDVLRSSRRAAETLRQITDLELAERSKREECVSRR